MKRTLILALLALYSVIFISCEDHAHDHSDHFNPEGWVFIDGTSARFMKIFRGQFLDDSKKEFTIENGEKSEHFKIKFFDKNQQEIDPPSDTDHKLSWSITNENLFEVDRHDGEEWEFHLEGKAVGITEIEFFVMHGDHKDVRSGKIKVVIE